MHLEDDEVVVVCEDCGAKLFHCDKWQANESARIRREPGSNWASQRCPDLDKCRREFRT